MPANTTYGLNMNDTKKKLTDKRFWLIWVILLLIIAVGCIASGLREDTLILSAAYALPLFSTWMCHRLRPTTAIVNLIVMITYNALFCFGIAFSNKGGAGFTWWFWAIALNTLQSIGMFIYCLFAIIHKKDNNR